MKPIFGLRNSPAMVGVTMLAVTDYDHCDQLWCLVAVVFLPISIILQPLVLFLVLGGTWAGRCLDREYSLTKTVTTTTTFYS